MPGTALRKVALITGASSGIGRAFAREYARRGIDLVVVARNAERLNTLASQLRADHGVLVEVLPGDLSDPATPRRLFDELSDRKIQVEILVNNAGFGVPGYLSEVEWERHRASVEVMASAPVHLCYLFAPAMQEQYTGYIINVSSLAALLPPHAGGTLYYPVKSFLHQFSIAFRAEMRSSTVHVTSLCPGFTRTGFQAAAGGTVENISLPKWTWSDPNAVARAGIKAVTHNKPVCVPGLLNKAIATLFKVLPGSVGRLLVMG